MISWKKASTESEGAKIIDNYDDTTSTKNMDFWTLTIQQQRAAIKYRNSKIMIRASSRDHLISYFKILGINPQFYQNNLLVVSNIIRELLSNQPDNNSKNVMINDFEIL